MKEVKIKVYDFEELGKNIQEKIMEENRAVAYDEFCEYYLKDEIEFYAKELLAEYFSGAEFIGVQYDFGYSQGCGAMIEFRTDKFEVIHDKYCHYYHERSFEINELLDDNGNYYELENIEELKEKIYEMNHKLVEYGYDLLENCVSETDIEEYLFGLLFYEDGKIYGEKED